MQKPITKPQGVPLLEPMGINELLVEWEESVPNDQLEIDRRRERERGGRVSEARDIDKMGDKGNK